MRLNIPSAGILRRRWGSEVVKESLVTPSVSEGPGSAGGAPPIRPGPSLTLGVTPMLLLLVALPLFADDWPQFAHDARHGGQVGHAAQPLMRVLADVEYDPFVGLEQAGT